jgi:hypothetical protein
MATFKKEEVDKMMEEEGNVKGTILQAHFDYIRDIKGDKGVEMVERRLEKLGYPVKAKDINNVKWYSEALACLILLVCVEVFDWGEKEVFEMAYEAPKYNFIVKLLMQHFIKAEKSFKMAPKYWKKHFDFSEMETVGFDEKGKRGTIRIKDFHKYHPLVCVYHKGYFSKVAEMMLGQKNVKVDHTECLLKDGPYEEFKLTWG